jgi:hypothetical protein
MLQAHQQFAPGQLVNALALAQMFQRPLNSALYMTDVNRGLVQVPSFQAMAADVDSDGDEDTTAIRFMPLTSDAGKVLAAGASGDIEFEPLKWVQILNFVFVPSLVEKILVTNFVIGQDPQFPFKGAIPAGVFAADSVNALIDVPWCGPGVPLSLTLKNIDSGSATVYGAARVRAVIG